MGAPLAVAIRRQATLAAAAVNTGAYTLAECLNAAEPIGPANDNVVSSMGGGRLKLERRRENWRVNYLSLDCLHTGMCVGSPSVPIPGAAFGVSFTHVRRRLR